MSADCTLEVHITKKHAGGVTKQIRRNEAIDDMTARLLVPSSVWQKKITIDERIILTRRVQNLKNSHPQTAPSHNHKSM